MHEVMKRILLSPIQDKILGLIKEKPRSRKELCNLLGKARTTIFDNCERLEKYKLAVRYSKGKGTGINGCGRPVVYWGVKKDEGTDN